MSLDFGRQPTSDSHVVLNLDAGEPTFPDRCVYCRKSGPDNLISMRSLGHLLGTSQHVVNRVFRVPTHRGLCTINARLNWTFQRYYIVIALAFGLGTLLLLLFLKSMTSFAFAGGVIVAMAGGFSLVYYQGKMPFKILVWPSKSGSMDYVFYFKDKDYAKAFREKNVERVSERHAIIEREKTNS